MSERQASTFRKGQFTDSHVKVLAYLNQLGVSYKAEEVVPCYGAFDGKGRPISYKVDVLVNDIHYFVGVIEIEGKGSKSSKGRKPRWAKNTTDEEIRDRRLALQGINWIEHLPNKEVSLLAVSEILARHKL